MNIEIFIVHFLINTRTVHLQYWFGQGSISLARLFPSAVVVKPFFLFDRKVFDQY
jgi:hypothetical protein